MDEITMNQMKPNQSGKVLKVMTGGSLRHRFGDLGLTENAEIRCVGQSPFQDPKAYLICDAVIAIRAQDCRDITVKLKS